MQALIATMFRVGFAPLVRACRGVLAPYLRSYALDKAQLQTVMIKVADKMQGVAVIYTAMGVAPAVVYTALDQQDIVEGIHDLLAATLTDYAVTVPRADLGRLLEAVADTIVP